MGLETIELVLEVEETFGISIPDDQAACICTAGDLLTVVLTKLEAGGVRCGSAMAFYRLRQALGQIADIDPRSIRPSTPLKEVIPGRERRRIWSKLSSAAKLRLPPLTSAKWVEETFDRALYGGLLYGLLLALIAALPLGLTPLVMYLPFALLWTVLVGILSFATLPLARVPDGTCVTFGDLSHSTARYNTGSLVADGAAVANKAETWNTLRKMISEQLGVRQEEILPSSRFVEDLNCG